VRLARGLLACLDEAARIPLVQSGYRQIFRPLDAV
jgi:hypothetical protein